MDKYDMSGVKVSGLGALFTEGVSDDEIQEVEISRLKAFRNHPYKVLDNKDMDELVESVREHGVLEAVICRKSGDGFEIISGHRRKRACELVGMKTVPARILDLSDDEATVYMVDANLRRETILFSEKAWAYRMKYEAIKHQGKKKTAELNKSSLSSMAEETNESGTQIKRYIRLTYLNPKLLEMVDEEKIPFSVGATLSFLDDKSQRDLVELIQEGCKIPSGAHAEQIKKLCLQGKMSKVIMEAILTDSYFQKEDTGEAENEEPEKDHSAEEQQKQPSPETSRPEPSNADIEAFYKWESFKTTDVITADDLKRRFMHAGGGGSTGLKNYKGSPRGVRINYKKELTYVQLAKRLKECQEKHRIAEEEAAAADIPETVSANDEAVGAVPAETVPVPEKEITKKVNPEDLPEEDFQEEDSVEEYPEEYGQDDVSFLLNICMKELKEYKEAKCPARMIKKKKIMVDALNLLYSTWSSSL